MVERGRVESRRPRSLLTATPSLPAAEERPAEAVPRPPRPPASLRGGEPVAPRKTVVAVVGPGETDEVGAREVRPEQTELLRGARQPFEVADGGGRLEPRRSARLLEIDHERLNRRVRRAGAHEQVLDVQVGV